MVTDTQRINDIAGAIWYHLYGHNIDARRTDVYLWLVTSEDSASPYRIEDAYNLAAQYCSYIGVKFFG